jgi:hypothetical protein
MGFQMRGRSMLVAGGLLALVVGGCAGAVVPPAASPTPAPVPTAAATPEPTQTPEPTPTPTEAGSSMTVVVTDTSCTYDGPEQVAVGEVAQLTARNDSTAKINVVLHSLHPDHSIEELEGLVADVQALIDVGEGPLPGPPWWTPAVSWVHNIEAGATGELLLAIKPDNKYVLTSGTHTGANWPEGARTICVVGGFEVVE